MKKESIKNRKKCIRVTKSKKRDTEKIDLIEEGNKISLIKLLKAMQLLTTVSNIKCHIIF